MKKAITINEIKEILSDIRVISNEHREKARFCSEHNFEIERQVQWSNYQACEKCDQVIRMKFNIYD